MLEIPITWQNCCERYCDCNMSHHFVRMIVFAFLFRWTKYQINDMMFYVCWGLHQTNMFSYVWRIWFIGRGTTVLLFKRHVMTHLCLYQNMAAPAIYCSWPYCNFTDFFDLTVQPNCISYFFFFLEKNPVGFLFPTATRDVSVCFHRGHHLLICQVNKFFMLMLFL